MIDSINNMINKIESGVSNAADIQYFLDVYDDCSQLWQSVRWIAVNPGNDIFFRARRATKELFCNISELKYPPTSTVVQKGRLNDVGESVAYLSFSPISPLAELSFDYYELYCMAEIQYTEKNIAIFSIGYDAEYEGLTPLENSFYKYFNSLLTRQDKKYYNATIALAKKFFKNDGTIISPTSLNIGIGYNSAQEDKTNQKLHNVAILPAAFDQCFKVVKSTYQMMSFDHTTDSIIVNNIAEGNIDGIGNIIWPNKNMEDIHLSMNKQFHSHCYLLVNEKKEQHIVKYPYGSGKVIKEYADTYAVYFNKKNLTKEVQKAEVVNL